jgi:hypothetical protein
MSTRVVTGKCRFSYFNALASRKNELSGKEEFSTQVLVPKADTETKQDGSPLGPEYAGCYFFNAKSVTKPGAVDANGHDLLGSQDIVSGDFGRVSLNAYAYSQAGNNGVSFGLNNIMLVAKGETLGGGRASAASDFGITAGKAPAPAATADVGDDW